MSKFRRMSKQLQSGVCQSCFSFQGIESRPDPSYDGIKGNELNPVQMPICSSTQRPLKGYCCKLEINLPSAASMRSNPTTIKAYKPKKTFIGNKEVDQLSFRDYLKQRRQEKETRIE